MLMSKWKLKKKKTHDKPISLSLDVSSSTRSMSHGDTFVCYMVSNVLKAVSPHVEVSFNGKFAY